MSRPLYRNNLPPGLKAQIVFAVILTVGALIVLPTTLSARDDASERTRASQSHNASPARLRDDTRLIRARGTVTTTVRAFDTGSFRAAAFADWD